MNHWVQPLYAITSGGRQTVRYRCSCDFVTGVCYPGVHDEAAHEMRVHLAVEHGMSLDAGRCKVCDVPTDDFRAAVTELGTDVWLCRRHAPALPITNPPR